ncbi:MAG TPA: hypothetical protein VFM74_00190, partial [Candidatus Limnocylindria bacterium]|nr:hypothetical protein [Candidatus Limnocylindria bacterium]
EEELPPVEAPLIAAIPIVEEVPAAVNGAAAQNGSADRGDEEADPAEMRRNIAQAKRSFDPDHQIRRAMDAFLSSAGTDETRRPDA